MNGCVLLHGFTGSAESFDDVRRALPSKFPTVAPTLPGHGEAPAAATLTEVLSTIDAAVAELGAPAAIAGYSMGGRLALHYVLRFPERVSNLVLFGARPGLSDATRCRARCRKDRELARLLRCRGLSEFMVRWEALPLLQLRSQDTDAVARSSMIRRRHCPEALAQVLEVLSVGTLPNLWPRLGELKIPVLWVAGERDSEYCALMRTAASATPAGEFRSIPDAGHVVLVDAPDAVARCLIDFLGC